MLDIVLFVEQIIISFLPIVISGWLDQTDVMCIPAFLGAEFACAVGMQAATEGEWADYTNMFKRSIRHLNFSLLQGFSGNINDALTSK